MESKKTNIFFKYSKKIKIISIIGVILCLIGIADATYLTVAHYSTTVTLACPTKGIINCEKVTNSSYSEVFGIPVAIYGLLFFIGMFILQLPMMWTSTNKNIRYFRLFYSIASSKLVSSRHGGNRVEVRPSHNDHANAAVSRTVLSLPVSRWR